jgi:hypothetical protein
LCDVVNEAIEIDATQILSTLRGDTTAVGANDGFLESILFMISVKMIALRMECNFKSIKAKSMAPLSEHFTTQQCWYSFYDESNHSGDGPQAQDPLVGRDGL